MYWTYNNEAYYTEYPTKIVVHINNIKQDKTDSKSSQIWATSVLDMVTLHPVQQNCFLHTT